jgi:uncharacterized protein YbjQ (UPF0145 family)
MPENQLLDVLTHEGVLINVSVRYWRATKKLKAEELGLDPDKITDRLINLGHKKLLPKEALEPFALIESRAHALVEAATFPFLHGLGHYLPNTKLSEVTTRLDQLEEEFRRAKSAFLANYKTTREKALVEWTAQAEKLVADPARLVAVVAVSFPDPEKMERYFEFSRPLFQIRAPEGLDLELVQAEEQQAVVQARQQAAEEAAQRIRQQTQTFVADCVATLRQQTSQLCEEMLDSMRTGKTGVHQKTLNRLIHFIDEFKKLNFAGDRQMEAELDRVRQEFLSRNAEEYRDDSFARIRLEQGLQGLADKARDLAKQDARELVEQFGQLGRRKFSLAA